MHNPDDNYPTRPGFEPSTSEFRAPTGMSHPTRSPITGTYSRMKIKQALDLCEFSTIDLILVSNRTKVTISIKDENMESHVKNWLGRYCWRSSPIT